MESRAYSNLEFPKFATTSFLNTSYTCIELSAIFRSLFAGNIAFFLSIDLEARRRRKRRAQLTRRTVRSAFLDARHVAY